jgi:hypothetical protein
MLSSLDMENNISQNTLNFSTELERNSTKQFIYTGKMKIVNNHTINNFDIPVHFLPSMTDMTHSKHLPHVSGRITFLLLAN